jgi:hypothetical protein
MRKARVAYTSGQTAAAMTMNGDAERFLKWRTKPVQKIRAELISLGGDERDIRVLERRLARRDTPDLEAVELGEERRG